jgi:hypothetical protein
MKSNLSPSARWTGIALPLKVNLALGETPAGSRDKTLDSCGAQAGGELLNPQSYHCPDVGCEVDDECVSYSAGCGCRIGWRGSRCRYASRSDCTNVSCIGNCCCGCYCWNQFPYSGTCQTAPPPGGGDCGFCDGPCPYSPAGCGVPHGQKPTLPPSDVPPSRRRP